MTNQADLDKETCRAASPSASVEPVIAIGRFTGADGIRAAACLWVVAGHLMMVLPSEFQISTYPFTTIYHGHLGVAMFFVLSGFLLSMPFWVSLANQQEMPSIRKYTIRRLTRIVPGYWVCVALTAVLAGAIGSRWDWIALALTAAFSNWMLAATYMPQFNRPLWSVSVEMVFYLLLPMTAWLMFKTRSMRGGIAVVLISILVIIIGQYYFLNFGAPFLGRHITDRSLFDPSAQSWATAQNPLALYGHFLIGVIAAFAHHCLPKTQSVQSDRSCNICDFMAIALIIGLILCEGQVARVMPVVAMMNYDYPVFPLVIGVLLVILPRSRFVGLLFDNGFFRLTATWSFGIYLWHVPLIHGLAKVWSLNGQSSIGMVLLFAACVFISAFTVAAASYRWIELPFIEWGRKATRA